jgi:hypothetical protein
MLGQGEGNGLANSHRTASLFISSVIVECGRRSTYDKSRLTFQSLHFVDKEVLEFKLQNDVDLDNVSEFKESKKCFIISGLLIDCWWYPHSDPYQISE